MAKSNSAFMKPQVLDDKLEAVVGKGPMPRSEIVKKMWDYIKKHNLQNPKNKRNIMADDMLKPIFDGKKEITMFEMAKHINNHINK